MIAPLDVVKIRMQLQTHRTHFGFRTVETSDIKYSNIRQALKRIVREEGIRGLYKGNMPAEYLYLSYSAVEFWAYKELEQKFEAIDLNHKVPHTVKTFGSGMIAGCIATAATYPFDLLRTRFAVNKGPQMVSASFYFLNCKANILYVRKKYNTSVTQAMMDIYHKEGPKGFYRGLWPAIIQIMPYMGLLFSSYDVFAKSFKKLRVRKKIKIKAVPCVIK